MAAKVPYTIDQPAALDDDEVDGLPPGQAHWWLRKGSDFIKLPSRVRGSEPLKVTINLEPGGYTLGCGPARGGVRVNLVVEAGAEPPAVIVRAKSTGKPAKAGSIEISGKTVVLTGDLEALDRDAAKAWLESLGAKVSSSVSKKTNLIIAGREPGPKKLAQAAELGIRVIEEAELRAAFEIPAEAPQAILEKIAKGTGGKPSPANLVAAYIAKVGAGGFDMKKVEKLVGPAHFRDLGLFENILWGISIGPRGGNYWVHIDLADRPQFGMRCNCSPKKPCNHSYALLLTADRHFVPPAPPPDGHAEQSRYVSFME